MGKLFPVVLTGILIFVVLLKDSSMGSPSEIRREDDSSVPELDAGDCACPKNFAPVCGSDGNTYDNMCLLQCNNPGVKCACLKECPCPNPVPVDRSCPPNIPTHPGA